MKKIKTALQKKEKGDDEKLTDDEAMRYALADAGVEPEEHQELIEEGYGLKELYDFLIALENGEYISADDFLRNRGPPNVGMRKDLTDKERADLQDLGDLAQARETRRTYDRFEPVRLELKEAGVGWLEYWRLRNHQVGFEELKYFLRMYIEGETSVNEFLHRREQ